MGLHGRRRRASSQSKTVMSPTSSLASRSLPLLAVILGANFLILMVYNAAWRASIQIHPVDDGGRGLLGRGALGTRMPRPQADFLGGGTASARKDKEALDVKDPTGAGAAAESSHRSESESAQNHADTSQTTSSSVLVHKAAVSPSSMQSPTPRKLDLLAYEDLMERRRELVTSGCDEMRRWSIPPTKNFPNVIVMKEKEVVWCPVFKAASSTWIKYLFETSSLSEVWATLYIDIIWYHAFYIFSLFQLKKDELRKKHLPEQPLKLLVPVSSRLKETLFKAYVQSHQDRVKSFLIVRHPFDRLVSAFRDKLERSKRPDYDKNWYYRTYGKGIVSRYRKDSIHRFGKDFFSKDNNFGAPYEVQGFRTEAMPTFWEFVQFVKASNVAKMDEHWRPTTNYCALCNAHYENIFLFENMDSGEGAYLKHVIDPKWSEREEWVNPNTPNGTGSNEVTKTYFKMLTDSDIMMLYKIYEFDFKMFGYQFRFRNLTLPY